MPDASTLLLFAGASQWLMRGASPYLVMGVVALDYGGLFRLGAFGA